MQFAKMIADQEGLKWRAGYHPRDAKKIEARYLARLVAEEIRPRGLPAVPWLSAFPELNVRTYVHDREGRPGVWFYSLDAARWLAVKFARAAFHLPYHHAAMPVSRDPGWVRTLSSIQIAERPSKTPTSR